MLDRPPTPATAPPTALDAVGAQQARLNRSTRAHWAHFAAHRARVESLLLPDEIGAGQRLGRLCVLGAGNCNDLDLGRLLERFEEICLVDLDESALEQAVARQGVEADQRVRRCAPVDLTGVSAEIGAWGRSRPTLAQADAVARRAEVAPDPEFARGRGPFDVVLSPCILSQITGYARDALGPGHPGAGALRAAVRRRHQRLLVDLLRPGGSALLVCDLASGASAEALAGSSRGDPSELLARRVGGGDHFAGLDPETVGRGFTHDPRIAPLVADARFIRPWLWTLGPAKTFLVYAYRVRRSTGAVLLPRRA